MRASALHALTAACTLLLAAPVASSQTVVLDFEEVACPPPGTGGGGYAISGNYTFGGYLIATTAVASTATLGQAVWCSGPNFAGSQAWFVNYVFSSTSRLSRPDGGLFGIESISLGTVVPFAGAAGPITFTGTLMQGGSVTQTFNVPHMATATLSPFQFDGGFVNLSALEWTGGSTGTQGPNAELASVQIDNLVLTRTVPEPETTVLLAIGFACLLGACKLRVPAAKH